MRPADLKSRILTLCTALSVVILVLMPFHAFLTVWGSTIIGHYTLLRLWKEALLAVAIVGVLYLLVVSKKQPVDSLNRRLILLILSYGLINFVWGIVAYSKHNVSLKALGFALIINLRFLAFFLVTWVISKYSDTLKKNWLKILIIPAIIVVTFGAIQEFLPATFLGHFGYSQFTILPFQYVDNNNLFLRVQSTLRGANPLGAYLVLIVTVMLAMTIIRQKKFTIRSFYSSKFLVAVVSLVTLFFTYSRSAWLGAILSGVSLFVMTQYRKPLFKRYFVTGVFVVLLISGLIAINIKHNRSIENVVLHTSQTSKSPITSNESHLLKLKAATKEVIHEPLGRGPGSAGPASVYNNHPARIAENYYIQIGQELGWIGLITFLLINAYLAYMLWLRRSDALALSLLASLIGISFINLLSHAWTDDTLAYIWWGLAGIAMVDGRLKVEDGKTKK